MWAQPEPEEVFMKYPNRIRSCLVASAVAIAFASPVFAQGGPNDAQIAGIVVAANQVDIDAGKVAEAKGTSKQVKDFGKMMVSDHAGVNKSATDLVTKL